MKGFGFEREKQEEFFEGKDKLPDLDAVEKMFCDEDAQQGLQENMKKRWYSILNEDIKEDVNLDHILYRIHYKINSEMNNRKKLNLESVIKWTGRVAAILILPLALYLAIQQFKPV